MRLSATLRSLARYSAVLVVLLAWSTPLDAQGARTASAPSTPLRLDLLGDAERIAEPGARLTLVVRIIGGAGNARSEVEIPADWTLVSGQGPVLLEGSAAVPLIVSLVAPASAAPGSFPVIVRVLPTAGLHLPGAAPTVAAQVQATLIVPERAAFDLQLLEAPSYLVAEQEYDSRILVRNSGNRVADVALAARTTRGGVAFLDVPSFRLAAGQQRTVTVRATAPRAPIAQDELLVTAADAVASGSDAAMARLTHRMRVVPRSAEQGSALQSIPLTATIRAAGAPTAGSNIASGTTYELVGRGPWQPRSATRLELVARYSETRNAPYAIRNEFRAAATGAWGNITLGHARYELTPLTTSTLLLLGAGGELRAGPLSIAAHAGYDDLRPDDTREAAARLGLRMPLGVELAATTLVREGADGSRREHHTGRVTLPMRQAGVLSVEATIPTALNAPLRGWAMNAAGAPFGFAYSARLIDGDSTWIGPRRGVLERNASISTPSVARVRLYANHASRQQNRLDLLELSDSLGALTAITDRSSLTRAGVAIGPWLRAEHREVLQSYNFVGTRSLREENGVNLTGSWRAGRRFNATAIYFRGDARAADTAPWRAFYRTTATATLHLAGRNAITLLADRQVTPDRASSADIVRTGVGAQLTLDSRRMGSSLVLGGRQNRGSGISLGAGAGVAVLAQRSFDATLRQALPGGYTLGMRWRAVESSARGTPWLQVGAVEMSVPLALPLGARRDVGGLSVQVRDETTGRPVPGVLVLVGNRGGLSDRNGRVTMHELPPGSYPVQIDRNTVPRGRVSTHDVPELVTVRPTQRAEVAVLLIQGAQIGGQLRRFDVSARTRLDDTVSRPQVDAGGLPGFVIEASLGAERRRTITDADGAFHFDQLRAGEWTLRVVGGVIPDLHRLEYAEQRVVVAPGGRGDANFRVVAVTRSIRMLPPLSITPTRTR